MALLKPPIMRLPRLRPLVLRRSIWSLRRASSQGIGPPPESTQSTPSCLMRRAESAGGLLGVPGCVAPGAPSATERAILGVSFPSKRGAGMSPAALAGDAKAAMPAVCIRFLREILTFTAPFSLGSLSGFGASAQWPKRLYRLLHL